MRALLSLFFPVRYSSPRLKSAILTANCASDLRLEASNDHCVVHVDDDVPLNKVILEDHGDSRNWVRIWANRAGETGERAGGSTLCSLAWIGRDGSAWKNIKQQKIRVVFAGWNTPARELGRSSDRQRESSYCAKRPESSHVGCFPPIL